MIWGGAALFWGNIMNSGITDCMEWSINSDEFCLDEEKVVDRGEVEIKAGR